MRNNRENAIHIPYTPGFELLSTRLMLNWLGKKENALKGSINFEQSFLVSCSSLIVGMHLF